MCLCLILEFDATLSQVLLRAEDAIQDYTKAITLIQGPGGEKADPAELQAS